MEHFIAAVAYAFLAGFLLGGLVMAVSWMKDKNSYAQRRMSGMSLKEARLTLLIMALGWFAVAGFMGWCILEMLTSSRRNRP